MLSVERRRVLLGLGASLLATPASAGLFSPSAELWDRWTAHSPGSSKTIDHSRWSEILQSKLSVFATGPTLVNYAGFSAGDRAALNGYIDTLSAQPISDFQRSEQFPFWINLYNALTVRVVLDHWPVKTIRDIDISPGLFSNGPWGAKLTAVEGESVSLDDIEHRILRPIWQDPRIHYAVNCAALGCPNLQSRAFTAAEMETMLDAGARAYVNDPRGVSARNGRVTVSSIYSWFQEDFGGTDEAVLNHLIKYAGAPLATKLQAAKGIDDDEYDWSINAVA